MGATARRAVHAGADRPRGWHVHRLATGGTSLTCDAIEFCRTLSSRVPGTGLLARRSRSERGVVRGNGCWSTRYRARGRSAPACPKGRVGDLRTEAADDGGREERARPCDRQPAHRLAVGPHHGRRDRRAPRLERGAGPASRRGGPAPARRAGQTAPRPAAGRPPPGTAARRARRPRRAGAGTRQGLPQPPAPGGGPQPDPVVHRRADRPGLPVRVDHPPADELPDMSSSPGRPPQRRRLLDGGDEPGALDRSGPRARRAPGRAGNRGPRRRPAVLPRPVSRRARARCCAAHPCGPRAGVPRAPECSARTPAAARRPCQRHPRQRPPRHRRRPGQPRPALRTPPAATPDLGRGVPRRPACRTPGRGRPARSPPTRPVREAGHPASRPPRPRRSAPCR